MQISYPTQKCAGQVAVLICMCLIKETLVKGQVCQNSDHPSAKLTLFWKLGNVLLRCLHLCSPDWAVTLLLSIKSEC